MPVLRVAPSLASEVVLPPASWPVAEDGLFDMRPRMGASSTTNGSEGLARSEPARALEPTLEPPKAEEMAEAADKAKQEEEVKSKAEAGVIAEEPVLENQSSYEVKPPQAEESKAGAAEA